MSDEKSNEPDERKAAEEDASEGRAMSDNESVEPHERNAAEEDAEEDLELQDEAAEQVQGGRAWNPDK